MVFATQYVDVRNDCACTSLHVFHNIQLRGIQIHIQDSDHQFERCSPAVQALQECGDCEGLITGTGTKPRQVCVQTRLARCICDKALARLWYAIEGFGKALVGHKKLWPGFGMP